MSQSRATSLSHLECSESPVLCLCVSLTVHARVVLNDVGTSNMSDTTSVIVLEVRRPPHSLWSTMLNKAVLQYLPLPPSLVNACSQTPYRQRPYALMSLSFCVGYPDSYTSQGHPSTARQWNSGSYSDNQLLHCKLYIVSSSVHSAS